MKIEKKRDKDLLVIALAGRLDSNTVTDLDNEVSDLNGVSQLIFDFEKLNYISSAGLRCILKCKKTIDNTVVINCNPEVYEIFNVTGFSEMMTVRKALRVISVDGCEKIGEGFYGMIYRLDPETIVKVYKIPDAIPMIKKETGLARKAFVMGIPTAIPYDIVKVGDLYGAVFELLDAEPIVKLINSDEALDDFAKKSAAVLKDMHQKEVQDEDLPSRKQYMLDRLEDCKEVFSNEDYERIVSLLNTIPDRNTLLHSDFHVKNVMSQKGDLLLIDMESLSYGHPIFEFGAMYASYVAFACVDKQNTDKFFDMPLDVTTKLFNKIFRYYYNDKSEEELESMIQKLSVISFIQVLYIRYKFGNLSFGMDKEEVEYSKNYLIEMSKKLDTLEY